MYHGPLEVTGDGYWVEAKDLQEGDVFLGANDELSTLVAAERVEFDESIRVYNFSVDEDHSYFVIAQVGEYGQTCILVHNANGIVYRALAEGEDPAKGLFARNPHSTATPRQHVNGMKDSPWISTSKNLDKIKKTFDKGNGLVEIDLSKIPDDIIVDVSKGFENGSKRVNNYAKYYEEVLIHAFVPPQAIKIL